MTENFDVIYCPGHQLELVFIALLAKLRNSGAKLIVWIHHLIPTPEERARYRSKSLTNLIVDILSFSTQEISIVLMKKYAYLIFTPTKHTRTKVLKKGFPPQMVLQIGNGVSLDRISNITPQRKVFEGCAISIHKRKGTVDLLRMWAMIKKRKGDCKMAIIGAVTDSIYELIDTLDLKKNVTLYGFVSEKDKIRILKSCKLFVSTSYEEGWSLSISEAMACGLPVIAYDNPVYREIYGESIVRVPCGDIKLLAEVILRILDNPILLDEYAIKSREWAINNSWERIAEKETAIIKEILSSQS